MKKSKMIERLKNEKLPRKPVSFSLPQDLIEMIDKFQKKNDINKSKLVEEVLRDFFEGEK